MPSSSMMMIHAPFTYACGNAAELRKIADELDKISLSTMQAYLQKAAGRITAEQLADMYAAEKYWSAAECIEMGLADRLADKDIDIEAAIAALSNDDGKDSTGNARQQLIRQAREAVASKAAARGKISELPEQVGGDVPEEPEGIPDIKQKQAAFLESAESKINKFFGKEM